MQEKRKYTREFKERAIAMLESSGKSGREIEQDLGIGSGMIYRWRAQSRSEGNGIRAFPGKGNPRDEELAKLRRELTVVKEEREILRKALAIFSKAKR